jgi:hypothetical protein
MQEIVQLNISLHESKPLIWRQILVHNNTTFFELHHIIQIVMGWKNYHMFEFNIEGYRIGEIDEEERNYGSGKLLDANAVTLKDIITQKKDIINYEYDFGDGWQHQIKVDEFLSVSKSIKYPICINGQMNCPPEDCGGIHAFYNSLDILKNKTHEEYKEMYQWFPKKYDSEKFDIEKVNRQLKKLDQYISKWMSGDLE